MTCRAVLRESQKDQEQKSTQSESKTKCVIECARDVSVHACDVNMRASL